MKRVICLLALLLLLPLSRSAAEAVELTVTPSAHQAAFACSLPGRKYAFIRYDTPFDTGEMTLYSETGEFNGIAHLPATYGKERLRVTVCSLSGETLCSVRLDTVEASDMPAPDPSLVFDVPATSKIRDMAITATAGGIEYAFTAPGRDMLYIQVRTGQESHQLALAASDGWCYTGFAALPYSYPDDKVTVTVTTYHSSHPLYTDDSLRIPIQTPDAAPKAAEGPLKGVRVCIDPGHQRKTQFEKVQAAPNIRRTVETKGGMALGVVTSRMESAVVLEIGFKLRDALLAMGADVLMTRDRQDTFVGMVERADIPNNAKADFVLRLHCNNSDDERKRGIEIYCPYQSAYAEAVATQDDYRDMGYMLLAAMQETTGVTRGGCTLTNAYVGNNWSMMPSFLVEMGYMSNHEEDLLLSSPEYQELLVRGMAEGVVRLARLRGLIP